MPLHRIRRFLHDQVAATAVEETTHLKRVVRRVVRLFYLAGRGFAHDEPLHRASALAFDTLLALIPLLAFLFSALKGLGTYEAFIDETVKPWIDDTFGRFGHHSGDHIVTLREAFVQVLDLGARTDIAGLGLIGLVALLYIVVMLLNTIEVSLSHIFGVTRTRSLSRKVADYAAILFVTPLSLWCGAAISAGFRSMPALGSSMDVLLELASWMTVSIGLAFLYLVMPPARVRLGSALLGGAISGLLWYAAFAAYVSFQVGVTRYNALYSSFAAIPLFLVWVFVSWLVVLFGAELAAAHQDEPMFRWRVLDRHASTSVKEYVALRMLVEVGRSFVDGEGPKNVMSLALAARVPQPLARQVLDNLVDLGVLASTESANCPAWVPARDLDSIRVAPLLESLRKGSSAGSRKLTTRRARKLSSVPLRSIQPRTNSASKAATRRCRCANSPCSRR